MDMQFYLPLEHHQLPVPYQSLSRRIRVLLPKNYALNLSQYYPVVYMHDGQNVFYSKESFSAHSWKTIPLVKNNVELADMIIVGIDNDGANRVNEYSTWQFDSNVYSGKDNIGGKGKEYADFIIQVVIPFINSTYRTKPQKEYTAMIGSSLGGNITQFMGVEYASYIGRLGIFSSASWLTPKDFQIYFDSHDLDFSQKIYIQVGTQEGDDTDSQFTTDNIKQLYIDASLSYYQTLLKKGMPIDQIKLEIIANGIHSETQWAQHLPDCLSFLSKDW
ncbi:alpha/beta hydrolase [Pasteurella canis]|uniref:Esterase n=1 Tax=Pasteurella canis TaxID=753 RepID=A0ABQ4VGI0_9PAST|nr:alpha/beta hydrolase-fold protein [Pasteurella canis]UEC22548.1 alpha/beta hydrolase [Pasteurella canis]GJH42996.1 esterase [Pasteurella canis]